MKPSPRTQEREKKKNSFLFIYLFLKTESNCVPCPGREPSALDPGSAGSLKSFLAYVSENRFGSWGGVTLGMTRMEVPKCQPNAPLL